MFAMFVSEGLFGVVGFLRACGFMIGFSCGLFFIFFRYSLTLSLDVCLFVDCRAFPLLR